MSVNDQGAPLHVRIWRAEGNGIAVVHTRDLEPPEIARGGRVQRAVAAYSAALVDPKPLHEWHEDDGPALWWAFPVREPPYVGTPNDSDWPGYHTHWQRILAPEDPA